MVPELSLPTSLKRRTSSGLSTDEEPFEDACDMLQQVADSIVSRGSRGAVGSSAMGNG